MKGDVLGFDPVSNSGAISGHDGERYEFVRLEWRSPSPPARGETVDFIPVERRATQIYPLGLRGVPAEGDTANIIYILYLVSLIVGITGIVGVVMAYVNRTGAPEWVLTHYRFQIRTFWIGLLYSLISLVCVLIIIGFFMGVLTVIWLIVRCAKGMQLVSRGAPYPAPATWLW